MEDCWQQGMERTRHRRSRPIRRNRRLSSCHLLLAAMIPQCCLLRRHDHLLHRLPTRLLQNLHSFRRSVEERAVSGEVGQNGRSDRDQSEEMRNQKEQHFCNHFKL